MAAPTDPNAKPEETPVDPAKPEEKPATSDGLWNRLSGSAAASDAGYEGGHTEALQSSLPEITQVPKATEGNAEARRLMQMTGDSAPKNMVYTDANGQSIKGVEAVVKKPDGSKQVVLYEEGTGRKFEVNKTAEGDTVLKGVGKNNKTVFEAEKSQVIPMTGDKKQEGGTGHSTAGGEQGKQFNSSNLSQEQQREYVRQMSNLKTEEERQAFQKKLAGMNENEVDRQFKPRQERGQTGDGADTSGGTTKRRDVSQEGGTGTNTTSGQTNPRFDHRRDIPQDMQGQFQDKMRTLKTDEEKRAFVSSLQGLNRDQMQEKFKLPEGTLPSVRSIREMPAEKQKEFISGLKPEQVQQYATSLKGRDAETMAKLLQTNGSKEHVSTFVNNTAEKDRPRIQTAADTAITNPVRPLNSDVNRDGNRDQGVGNRDGNRDGRPRDGQAPGTTGEGANTKPLRVSDLERMTPADRSAYLNGLKPEQINQYAQRLGQSNPEKAGEFAKYLAEAGNKERLNQFVSAVPEKNRETVMKTGGIAPESVTISKPATVTDGTTGQRGPQGTSQEKTETPRMSEIRSWPADKQADFFKNMNQQQLQEYQNRYSKDPTRAAEFAKMLEGAKQTDKLTSFVNSLPEKTQKSLESQGITRTADNSIVVKPADKPGGTTGTTTPTGEKAPDVRTGGNQGNQGDHQGNKGDRPVRVDELKQMSAADREKYLTGLTPEQLNKYSERLHGERATEFAKMLQEARQTEKLNQFVAGSKGLDEAAKKQFAQAGVAAETTLPKAGDNKGLQGDQQGKTGTDKAPPGTDKAPPATTVNPADIKNVKDLMQLKPDDQRTALSNMSKDQFAALTKDMSGKERRELGNVINTLPENVKQNLFRGDGQQQQQQQQQRGEVGNKPVDGMKPMEALKPQDIAEKMREIKGLNDPQKQFEAIKDLYSKMDQNQRQQFFPKDFDPSKVLQQPKDVKVETPQPGKGDGKDAPQLGKPADLKADVGGGQLQQQSKLAGLDLNDKGTREFMQDALRRLEHLKLDQGQLDSKKLQDALKGLDPDKVARLEALLKGDKQQPLGKLDEGMLGKLREAVLTKDVISSKDMLALMAKELNGQKPTGENLTTVQKAVADRLGDFIKSNSDNGVLQLKDQKGLAELGKVLNEVNKTLGLEGKNALTVADMLGKSIDGRRLAGDVSQTGMTSKLDAGNFVGRLNPSQEQTLRNMLESAKSTATEGRQIGQQTGLDVARAEAARTIATRIAGLDAAPAAQTQTGRETGRDVQVTRSETTVKVEATGAIKDMATRADAAATAAAKADAIKADTTLAGKPELAPTKEGVAAKTGEVVPGTGKDAGARGQELSGKDVPGAVKPGDAVKADPRSELAEGTVAGKNLAIDKALEEKQKKEKEEKEKDEKELTDEEKAKLNAALLAALAEKKRREQQEKEEKEKERAGEKDKNKDEDKRRKYIVREKDTLESIAIRQLRDGRLAPLIFEINKEVIGTKMEKGRAVADLRPKTIIWLPSQTEIKDYRARLFSGGKVASAAASDQKVTAEEELAARFGSGWDGSKQGLPAASDVASNLTAAAVEAANKRRANIESLLGPLGKQKPADGRIRYIVRLGDSLKSVAMKHPALQDVMLWKLLAQVNGISEKVDNRGNPTAQISRGATLMIPTPDEIESYRNQMGLKKTPVPSEMKASVDTSVEMVAKECPQCGRMTVKSATICPACTYSFAMTDDVAPEGVVTTLEERPHRDAATALLEAAGFMGVKSGRDAASGVEEQSDDTEFDINPRTGGGSGGTASSTVTFNPIDYAAIDEKMSEEIERGDATAYSGAAEGVNVLEVFDEYSRLVEFELSGYVLRLEALTARGWEHVVAYEIYDDISLRHEYSPGGSRKTVRIDLPPTPARELAGNDLRSNWDRYVRRFLDMAAV